VVVSGEDRPVVALRRYIESHYELGRHSGRPVALLRSREGVTDGPLWLDTPAGLAAWRYELLHGDRSTRWWNGTPLVDVERLVLGETIRQTGELASHGRELGLSGEYGALADLAERRSWGLSDLKQRYRDRAMGRALDEVLDHQDRQRAMEEAAADFAWVDLAALWDTEPPTPEYLARSDGPCVFYAGMRNLMVGFTESGKSWLVALSILQEIRAERPVVYNDHENGIAITIDRLRSLGLTKDQVTRFVRYTHRPAPLPPELAAQEAEKLWAEGARLMYADALTPIAHSLGLDTSGGDTNAVEEVYQIALDPWVHQGFAGVLLDNTPKGNKYGSLGSQHKDAGVGGAVVTVVAETKFSKRAAGSSRIYLNKDRGGDAETVLDDDRRWWGTMRVTPDPVLGRDGRTRTSVSIEPPPEAPEALEALYEEADRKVATLALAREALVRNGITATDSMKQLADWMSVVQPLDPAFEHAHIDRGYVTDVLFTGTAPADHAEAGLQCTSTSYRDKARRVRHRYRVEAIPMPSRGE
jgi:hypothetical protein